MHEDTSMNTRKAESRYAPRELVRRAKHGELERWEINPNGSQLGFSLRHLVFQQIRGRFRRWGGTLFLDRAAPERSSVHVWVEPASIETDSPDRDAHIRSAEFLDVARFPQAEFESTSVDPGERRLVLRGRLRLRDVTHDVELEIERGAGAVDPARNVYTVRGRLNRQAFGLHWNQDLDVGGVVLGDEIEISAEVEVVRGHDDLEGNA
jgi:polyisoprenoid-binding protein YceI